MCVFGLETGPRPILIRMHVTIPMMNAKFA